MKPTNLVPFKRQPPPSIFGVAALCAFFRVLAPASAIAGGVLSSVALHHGAIGAAAGLMAGGILLASGFLSIAAVLDMLRAIVLDRSNWKDPYGR